MVSKDCIKPSSPTPRNLKNHKLSFLDLYLHPYYIPIVLYWTWIFPYPILILSFTKDCNTLKQSLSEALSLFYPFHSIIIWIWWFIFISSRWCIPKRNMHAWHPCIANLWNLAKCVIRRFNLCFDSFAETNLVEAKSLQNPTRVEAVTSLLCKCVMPVLKMENLNHKSNLLGKATPPMSEYQMENLERMASVSCKN